MKNLYRSLSAVLLLSAATAATPPPPAAGPLQAAQSIALGEHAMLAGTLSLPNHNMVLLLTDAESFDITAQCLAPDGHTVWKTGLKRFQRLAGSGYMFDTRQMAFSRTARDNKQLQKDKLAAALYPVNVFTDGNRVVLAERLDEDSFKKQNKDKALKDGQMFVQRIDEKGGLQAHLFDPRPGPESKKTEANTLGRYADATGYAEVVRETNKREETLVFATMHYDLGTNAVRREVLELPATPEHVGGMNSFRHWYQEWAYLGHRPNQTYFCRRTVTSVAAPKEKAGNQPIVYQVHIADDQGGLAGGFSTTLGLNKGTRPMNSGYMPSPGEMNHIPFNFSASQGKSYVTYDEWDVSCGGMGSFYLDYRTGDVLVYGEYGEGELPEMRDDGDLLGFFERRFAPDGHVVAQVQAPYSEAMKAKKKKASFRGYSYRSTRFHVDPLTGQHQFSFAPVRLYGNGEDFDLFLDSELKPLRYDYLPGKDKDERTYTSVMYTQPFKLATTFNSTDEIRFYEHAGKTDHPVYAALEKQRRTAPVDAPDHWFHLCPTGPATGLVVEQKSALGGSLQVYTFQ
ncbi:hypothetical protein ACFP2F_10955 [Hymenobacter artigasi]|uniref:DUF4968 domain-containing protein n=1 Tax=Hymenobacter artigasi TaxID=2719616 RepID=A0ABX1HIV6_9BACT|nr:hypothetical protein [Hymenobacter artigasi]NKI90208.1 hypothetical protein [Hymenobacter artigasi]